MKTIDLTPTPDGYRRIIQGFQYAIQQHDKDIIYLERIFDEDSEVHISAPDEHTIDLIDEAIGCLITRKRESVSELLKQISIIHGFLARLEVEPNV